MSILQLAIIGGIVSFVSTAVGSFLFLTTYRLHKFTSFKFSIDFALGVMLSAVAFSLVGPVATQSINKPQLLIVNFFGFILGGFAIWTLKFFIDSCESSENKKNESGQLLLALALLVHNFPEGLASGAAMAGLDFSSALPILSSISLQNIPEGLLMVLALKAMGWKERHAVYGGIASGAVELIGGVLAGLTLQASSEALPFLLMLAGGAMFTSVVIEINQKSKFKNIIFKSEFAIGLLTIPLLNNLLS